MEYVAARSLEDVFVDDGPICPDASPEIGLQMLDALGRAHAPASCTVTSNPATSCSTTTGGCVLTDFGIATYDGATALTQTGTVHGLARLHRSGAPAGRAGGPRVRPVVARRHALRRRRRTASVRLRDGDGHPQRARHLGARPSGARRATAPAARGTPAEGRGTAAHLQTRRRPADRLHGPAAAAPAGRGLEGAIEPAVPVTSGRAGSCPAASGPAGPSPHLPVSDGPVDPGP